MHYTKSDFMAKNMLTFTCIVLTPTTTWNNSFHVHAWYPALEVLQGRHSTISKRAFITYHWTYDNLECQVPSCPFRFWPWLSSTNRHMLWPIIWHLNVYLLSNGQADLVPMFMNSSIVSQVLKLANFMWHHGLIINNSGVIAFLSGVDISSPA